MPIFEVHKLPKLISHKILVEEKFVNFHTVIMQLLVNGRSVILAVFLISKIAFVVFDLLLQTSLVSSIFSNEIGN